MSPAQLAREIEALGEAELTKKERNQLVGNVSYHCKQLCELDCAELAMTRPVRGAVEHFYRATERPLIDTEEWDQLDPLTAEDLVSGYVQEILDDFVASRKAEMVGFDPDFHITRTAYRLDTKGLQEGLEVHERCRLEMVEVQRRSAERLSAGEEAAVSTSSSLVYFKIPSHRHGAAAPRGATPSSQSDRGL